MVAHRAGARDDVHPRRDPVTDADAAGPDDSLVAEDGGLDFLRILDGEDPLRALQRATVADLAAGLGIEGGVVEDDDAQLALVELLDGAAIAVQSEYAAVALERLVAMEGGFRAAVFECRRHAELAGRARLLLLLCHRRVEGGDIDPHATLAADVGRQVERETEGIVQLERGLPVEDAVASQRREFALEDSHAVLDGLEEAHLLLPQHLDHACLAAQQLGICSTHLDDQVGHQSMEERRARAELVAVPDGAPDDPPQDVTAPLVAGNDAIGDQERAGADVVGEDAQRGAVEVGRRRFARGGGDEVDEEVDLVVAVHVLQDRRCPLEPHAGIDRWLRQRVHDARLVAVELHEDVVPDLDVAVALLVRRSRRPARNSLAVVVEDLGAWPAGTGIAHHPEVVRGVARTLVVADPHHPLGRHADVARPQVVGFVVLGIDAHPESLGRQPVDVDQQFPGVADRVALEVVAEGEVAKHLEEGVVTRRVADVLEVVVLAAGTDALLRGRRAQVGPLVETEEDVLELVHAGVGEQQRRIVVRHERTRGNDLVAFGFEEPEELLADFSTLHCRRQGVGRVQGVAILT
ncbi:MAG: hypothetical protein FAZ92_00935 [Accumulibacter sp.]|nr:MAG: hypothetical protein FAZ92_00935 [Accumulibacter sp.]